MFSFIAIRFCGAQTNSIYVLILRGWGLFSAYDVNVSSQQDLLPRRKSKYELGYLFPVYTHTIRILIYVLSEVSLSSWEGNILGKQ